MGPHPAVAAVRLGVRRGLSGLPARALVLAACSGGADSLALAAALAFEAPRLGLRAGGITVDHGLQAGSAAQAERVTAILVGIRLDPVRSVTVSVLTRPPGRQAAGPLVSAGGRRVDRAGAVPPDQAGSAAAGRAGAVPLDQAGSAAAGRAGAVPLDQAPVARENGAAARYRGPEAAARSARYAALDAVADELGAAVILLGHTMDDQAETVLLGLARGSGARSLAGMAPVSGRYLRPLLGLRREQTRAACAAAGLEAWEDPHNSSQEYRRVRVRERILPLMEEMLGPGVTEALARTGDQLRADADALDAIARERAVSLRDGGTPDVAELAALPAAIRTRLLRMAAIAAGSPGGALTARHVADLDALVTGWHGQRWADLPGGVRCQRRRDRLYFTTQDFTTQA
jgi:tRNA(Ile)-lysidine synthase